MSTHRLNLSLLGAFALAGATGTSWAGPIYAWNWAAGDAGAVSHTGGKINWIESTFDTNTNRLAWYGNFGSGSGPRTDGFTLTIRSGDSPRTAAGQVAQLYFDGVPSVTGPTTRPKLTAYGYNGLTDQSSFFDGAPQNGIQEPDRIESSIAPSSSWVHDLTFRSNADGSRTLGFEIDVTPLVAHTPLWPGTSGWTGTEFGETVGLYMQTVSGVSRTYSDGFLTSWNRRDEGFLDISGAEATDTESPADPVPEPTALTLLGMGTAGILGWRIRGRHSH